MSQIPTISRHWIHTSQGKLFAQCWLPGTNRRTVSDTPILLLHDSLGCVALWRDFPALLARQTGLTVIAYDRLGFGQSDARHDRLSPDFIAEEASIYFPQIREYFGFARCIVMGHSVGGGMAVHCAAYHPNYYAALVTESAQAFVEDRTRAGIELARAQFREETALQRLARYHGDKARWVVDAWTETWLSPSFADWSLTRVLPLVRCPTLVIHGAEDEYGSNRHPERIAHGIRAETEMVIMPATRHVPHRGQDLSVALTVDRFIQRHLLSAAQNVPGIFRLL